MCAEHPLANKISEPRSLLLGEREEQEDPRGSMWLIGDAESCFADAGVGSPGED